MFARDAGVGDGEVTLDACAEDERADIEGGRDDPPVGQRDGYLNRREPEGAPLIKARQRAERRAITGAAHRSGAAAEALKLGTKIVITTAEGNVVAICGAGNEKLTDAQIDAVFVAKKK